MRGFESLCVVCGAHMDLTGRLDAAPLAGASNPGRLIRQPGGAGLNTASVAAALGLATSLAGPVGDDADGQELRQAARSRGIAEALVAVAGRRSGTFSSIIAPDGQQVIGLADLSIYEEADAGWFLGNCGAALDTADAWLLTANQTATTLAQLAEKAGARVIAVATVSAAKAHRVGPVLDRTDLLFCNLAEARALTALPGAGPAELARTLAARGVKAGVISASGGPVTYWQGNRIGRATPPPIAAIDDVNGAGDALAGTVIAGLSRGAAPGKASGMDLGAAVAHGIAAAQLTLASRQPVADGLSWPRLSALAAGIAVSTVDR